MVEGFGFFDRRKTTSHEAGHHSHPSEDVILPSGKLLCDSLREFLSTGPEGEKELGLFSLWQGGRYLQVKQKRCTREESIATICGTG